MAIGCVFGPSEPLFGSRFGAQFDLSDSLSKKGSANFVLRGFSEVPHVR